MNYLFINMIFDTVQMMKLQIFLVRNVYERFYTLTMAMILLIFNR